MSKKKKGAVKINKIPNPREVNDIMLDTTSGPNDILDLSVQGQTTEGMFNTDEPQGSTRNDLTITFRYNFDRITKLKEIALEETKKNWKEDEDSDRKPKRKSVQYTDLMRRSIDEVYFGGK